MPHFPSENMFLNVLMGAGVFLLIVLIHDVFLQKRRAILHNFPVVGHLRYLLEKIGPELRQYWVANDKEERPFDRSERRWVYASSKGQNNNFGFGTVEQIYTVGYPILKKPPISARTRPQFPAPRSWVNSMGEKSPIDPPLSSIFPPCPLVPWEKTQSLP